MSVHDPQFDRFDDDEMMALAMTAKDFHPVTPFCVRLQLLSEFDPKTTAADPNAVLFNGSGFVHTVADRQFLITCKHLLTGKNPLDETKNLHRGEA